MLPTLKHGQLVLADFDREPRVGDIVIALKPDGGGEIIKRLIKIEADGYWLEGDAHDPTTAATSHDSWLYGAFQRNHILAVVRHG